MTLQVRQQSACIVSTLSVRPCRKCGARARCNPQLAPGLAAAHPAGSVATTRLYTQHREPAKVEDRDTWWLLPRWARSSEEHTSTQCAITSRSGSKSKKQREMQVKMKLPQIKNKRDSETRVGGAGNMFRRLLLNRSVDLALKDKDENERTSTHVHARPLHVHRTSMSNSERMLMSTARTMHFACVHLMSTARPC